MICITFDTDHMPEKDMEVFLNRFSIPGKATFFVHRRFPVLESTTHEVCPHPFIHDLRDWDKAVTDITRQLRSDPVGIRTHSCVFSHPIAAGLKRRGFRYISQAQSMFQSGLLPFRHPWGIWEMPIYYMDHMDISFSEHWPEIKYRPFDRGIIDKALADDSLYIFDMHPTHIALNTRTYGDYLTARDAVMQRNISPFDLRRDGRGAGEFFSELCARIDGAGTRSYTCTEALDHFTTGRDL